MVKWLGNVSEGKLGIMPSGAQTPLLAQSQQMRRAIALGIVPAKAIERHQHHIMRVLRRC